MSTSVKSFLIICFSFLTSLSIQGQSIEGPTIVCSGNCYEYTYPTGIAGQVSWSSTIGDFDLNNSNRLISICFDEIGETGLIEVYDQISKTNTSLVVQIDGGIEPIINYSTILSCQDSLRGGPDGQEEGIQCVSTCPNAESVYSTPNQTGYSYTWKVVGGNIVLTNNNFVAVKWANNTEAALFLTTISPNGCLDSTFTCIDILEETNSFIKYNGQVVSSISICRGQEIQLKSITDGISSSWISSDGRAFSGSNISISYDQPGTYTMDLYAISDCNCTEKESVEIIVEAERVPAIECIGTTCQDMEETYFAADACSNYQWNVSGNGTITDGGGTSDNFISVEWGTGPEGTVSLAASGCPNDICSKTNVQTVPIITSTVAIAGKEKVCAGAIETYTAPYFQGTNYSWTLNPRGYIISGQGTHEISVQWDDRYWVSGKGVIDLVYDNCLLECGGTGQIEVDILEEPTIYASPNICLGSSNYVGVNTGALCDWTLTSPSGLETKYNNVNSFNHTYNEVGYYSIVAKILDINQCKESLDVIINVSSLPESPKSINGPSAVCAGEEYTYSIDNSSPNQFIAWEVIDGTNTFNFNNEVLTYTWISTGPYIINVSIRDGETYCYSDPLSVNMAPAQNLNIIANTPGCIDELGTYSLPVREVSNVTWNITPPDAGAMTKLSDNTIQVQWQKAGNHSVSATYCGNLIISNVTVNARPTPSPISTRVCTGDLATGSIGLGAVTIFDDTGLLISSGSNYSLGKGNYVYEVVNSDGCSAKSTIEILEHPEPIIRLSSPEPNGYCLPYPEISIVATNTEDGYTYKWFRDGVPFAGNVTDVKTNVYGDYQVQITDINGCSQLSNVHRLFEYCGGGMCNSDGDEVSPEVIIAPLQIECDSFEFELASSGHQSTIWTWYFDDTESGMNTATGTKVHHRFSKAGYYYINIYGNVPPERNFEIIEVPVAPRFDVDNACIGEAAQFTDISTFIPGRTITRYHWNFGDIISSDNTSTLQNPTHIFSTPGTYTVSLLIEASTGCVSTFTKDITIYPVPTVQLNFNDFVCTSEAAVFDVILPPSVTEVEWDFGDVGSGNLNTSKSKRALHTFSNPGTYFVTLTTSDAFNCEHLFALVIEAVGSSTPGIITADKANPICPQDEVTLEAPSGALAYQWSNGATTSSITIDKSGSFKVTVTPSTGCPYVTDPYQVVKSEDKSTILIGQKNYDYNRVYTDLVVCLDDDFSINLRQYISGTYLWSTGQTNNWVSSNQLRTLGPGVHQISLNVIESTSGCEYDLGPFRLEIIDYPSAFSIESDQSVLCEGEVHELRITSPNPDYEYIWSNGQTGTSIQAASAGFYTATAYNSAGCERFSNNGISISGRPDIASVMTGCIETCFPDVLCAPTLNYVSTHTWLLDGAPISSGNAVTDLNLTTPGEYQLVVSNFAGCQDTSGILNIESTPGEQRIEGLIFIDENENCQYDAGELFIDNAEITLYGDGGVTEIVNCDANGVFIFDPVESTNNILTIDEAALGYFSCVDLTANILIFDNCKDTINVLIPLQNTCPPITSIQTIEVCQGESTFFEGVSLNEGDTQDFTFVTPFGCDSMVTVNVVAFTTNFLTVDIIDACQGQDNGSLILPIDPVIIEVVHNGTSYIPGDVINDLAPGLQNLQYIDINGCPSFDQVSIQEAIAPSYTFDTPQLCPNETNGSITINANGSSNLEIAVDQISSFTSVSNIQNLSVGSHILYLREGNCIYEEPFDITVAPEPTINLSPQSSCISLATGEVTIDFTASDSLQFALGFPGNFQSNQSYTALNSGSHIVYFQDLNGCIFEESFIIDEFPQASVDIDTDNACTSIDNGSIILSNPSSISTFSVDGNLPSTALEYSGLNAGLHTLTMIDDNFCPTEFMITIDTFETPSFALSVGPTCEGSDNGSVQINSTELTGATFQLNGNTSNSPDFTGLPLGNQTLVITDANGCIQESNFTVDAFVEYPVLMDSENPCPGIDNGIITITDFENNMTFSIDGNAMGNDPLMGGLSAGLHTVIVTDQNTCTQVYDVQLDEANALEVEFEDVDIDCSMNEVTLTPLVNNFEGDLTYTWSNGTEQTELRVDESGTYTVNVADKCSQMDHNYDIQFIELDDNVSVGFANVFSPNGDNINDCFRPIPKSDLDVISYNFQVFDRWGNLVFNSKETGNCWDGRFGGSLVSQGVYVYTLELDVMICTNVKQYKKAGDITVVR